MSVRATLIERVRNKVAKLFSKGAVHDRNVSAEKGSGGHTVGVYTPTTENDHEASCKNDLDTTLKIRYIGPSKESATEHYKTLQKIEDLVEDFINEEIENPAGDNYSTKNIRFEGIETDDEEDMDRLDSVITWTVEFEYLRGSANVN